MESDITIEEAKYRETPAAKAVSSKLAELDRALPPIAQRDVDELAANPIVIRLMSTWEVVAEGMGESAKRALLWSIFETVRASFELKKGSAGRVS